MRKIILIIGALLISANVIAAAPQNLSSAVTNNIQNYHSTTHPLVYGGQDISHPLIATAVETLWSGQRTLIG